MAKGRAADCRSSPSPQQPVDVLGSKLTEAPKRQLTLNQPVGVCESSAAHHKTGYSSRFANKGG
jgi:hypothetical protein